MPKFYPSIEPALGSWAMSQPIFFIASAPTHGQHVNLSPKGMPSTTFAILSPNQCAYIDRTGSGCETISHLYENGRATVMFCSFGSSPRIMRLFAKGRVVEWDTPEFERLLTQMKLERVDAARAIVVLDVWKVQTSCGYGVPKVRGPDKLPDAATLEKQGTGIAMFEDRPTLAEFNTKRARANLVGSYQIEMNMESLDGLPGLKSARRDSGEKMWLVDLQTWWRSVLAEKNGITFGFGVAVLFYIVLVAVGVRLGR